jgi:hypothetical protein
MSSAQRWSITWLSYECNSEGGVSFETPSKFICCPTIIHWMVNVYL